MSSTVTKRFQRRLKTLGLPRVPFHALRHSAGSLLAAQGLSLRSVAEVWAMLRSPRRPTSTRMSSRRHSGRRPLPWNARSVGGEDTLLTRLIGGSNPVVVSPVRPTARTFSGLVH
jgi:hypothetical protein